MKIRTDFVTNSSSSSFTLMIRFDLMSGESVQFNAMGGTDEAGVMDYFDSDAIVKVSPKQLGTANGVEQLITLLKEGIVDGWDEVRIFDESDTRECYGESERLSADWFIEDIREKIPDMDQIREIMITGDEENYVSYKRTYKYNLKTKKYTGIEIGCEFEKDGASGGDLQFEDLDSCEIEYVEEE